MPWLGHYKELFKEELVTACIYKAQLHVRPDTAAQFFKLRYSIKIVEKVRATSLH